MNHYETLLLTCCPIKSTSTYLSQWNSYGMMQSTNQKYRFNNKYLLKLVERPFFPPIHVESGANFSWSWNNLSPCLTAAPSETTPVWLTFCWLSRKVRRCGFVYHPQATAVACLLLQDNAKPSNTEPSAALLFWTKETQPFATAWYQLLKALEEFRVDEPFLLKMKSISAKNGWLLKWVFFGWAAMLPTQYVILPDGVRYTKESVQNGVCF